MAFTKFIESVKYTDPKLVFLYQEAENLFFQFELCAMLVLKAYLIYVPQFTEKSNYGCVNYETLIKISFPIIFCVKSVLYWRYWG